MALFLNTVLNPNTLKKHAQIVGLNLQLNPLSFQPHLSKDKHRTPEQ